MDMDAEALGLPPVRQIDPVRVVTNGCRHVQCCLGGHDTTVRSLTTSSERPNDLPIAPETGRVELRGGPSRTFPSMSTIPPGLPRVNVRRWINCRCPAWGMPALSQPRRRPLAMDFNVGCCFQHNPSGLIDVDETPICCDTSHQPLAPRSSIRLGHNIVSYICPLHDPRNNKGKNLDSIQIPRFLARCHPAIGPRVLTLG